MRSVKLVTLLQQSGVIACLGARFQICAGKKVTDAVKGTDGGEKRNRVLLGRRLLKLVHFSFFRTKLLLPLVYINRYISFFV